jgi:hypothetical protein
MFLAARCSKYRKPYLIRYRLTSSGREYEPVRTHVVDEDYFAGDAPSARSSLSSQQFVGIPPCPVCGRRGMGACECGTLFCFDREERTVVCPGCRASGTMGGSGGFGISGRHG